MKRCFIALNLPENIKTEFAKIQADLKHKNQGVQIAWVEPKVAHINLYFLGNLDEKGINDLKKNLKALEGKFGPISLVLTGTGAFPSIKTPRILFLGVKHKGENDLIKLYQETGRILEDQNLKVDSRPFIAHITLGRIKDGPLTGSRQKISFFGEEMKNIEFKVNSFELMGSVLTPSGPEYKIIQSYEL